jgi:membrane associated rhomboid family serine protease
MHRPDLTRRPVLTAVVFGATAIVNAIQLAVPPLLGHLERRPAEAHGQWWRLGTTFFVQDGGVYGTVSNLLFLCILGALAEQVLARPQWLAYYFGVGLVGQAFGYWWQPVGGGNSVAICGLTGAVTIAYFRRDPRLPALSAYAVLVWLGALLASWRFPLLAVGLAGAWYVQYALPRGRDVSRFVLAAAIAVGVVLCAVRNIHGAALLGGLVAAGVVALVSRRPVPADPSTSGL